MRHTRLIREGFESKSFASKFIDKPFKLKTHSIKVDQHHIGHLKTKVQVRLSFLSYASSDIK